MQILLTFLTIIAYYWGGLAVLGALVGLAAAVFATAGETKSTGGFLLLQCIACGILPWAFLLARYLCR